MLFTQCPWAKLCTPVTSLEPFSAHMVAETDVNNTPGTMPPQRCLAQPGHAHVMGSGSLGAWLAHLHTRLAAAQRPGRGLVPLCRCAGMSFTHPGTRAWFLAFRQVLEPSVPR